MKRFLIIAVLAFVTAVQAYAQQSEIFAPGGKAIKGYDPVAFFTESKPVKGSDKFQYKWKDATWFFSSNENLEAFKADPEKYAPQYGGYCAYGTSQGHKAPTQTDTWTVLNDKLYFNYNDKVKELWTKDQANLIKTADEKWPEVKGQK
ncbi:YHS domain-containing (seleno)protein [Mucilaginibacter sp. cycad4]|uniref:YHS domain-containing (seleno)protein n=1 Tax=Mucilaginibacter sp. cycad4 TaxID=3342096 RepID=UPI002AAA881A|nr:YHS domain-containing (seleno)protein [Mucilaginibacter gossypii]WPU98192.1 YHS domain-containing (seleno)protein [Mucilaginibacter gossypii]